MLTTQFSDASGQFMHNGGLGAANPAVSALQQSLVKFGQMPANGVTGSVNDATLSALWKLFGANLTKTREFARLISTTASDFVGAFADAIAWIDEQVASIPFADTAGITTASVLANWVNINTALGYGCGGIGLVSTGGEEICDAVITRLAGYRTTVFSAITSKADIIKKIVDRFGAPPGTTTTNPKNTLFRPDKAYGPGTTVPGGALAPTASPHRPATPKYPAGSIARFNTTRKVWSIYRPIATGLGLSITEGFDCLYGDCASALNGARPPSGYELLTTAQTSDGARIANPSTEKDTALTSWWFWALIGVAAVGGTGVVIYRRKKRAA